MDTKPWYTSKGVWSAIGLVIASGVGPISTSLGHPITVPDWIFPALQGLGIYGIRTGDKPIA